MWVQWWVMYSIMSGLGFVLVFLLFLYGGLNDHSCRLLGFGNQVCCCFFGIKSLEWRTLRLCLCDFGGWNELWCSLHKALGYTHVVGNMFVFFCRVNLFIFSSHSKLVYCFISYCVVIFGGSNTCWHHTTHVQTCWLSQNMVEIILVWNVWNKP